LNRLLLCRVSVKRSYSSAKREAQARDTRRSILDAALELFVASGYSATSIQRIAERAGVAVQTVYAVFGTKRDLLRELIETRIAGGDESLPITERPEAQSVAAEPDADRRAQAPGREPELAGLLVRSLLERQRQRRSAQRAGEGGDADVAGSRVVAGCWLLDASC